jgi:coproporphyrinogen III oxidase-like Fe-S oxidoreductase
MKNNTSETYTGTIDDLLEHCSNLDIQEVEEQMKRDEKEDCLNVIMTDFECSLEEAEQIYNDIALNEVKETMKQLLKDGIVQISGYNDEGEPLFTLTELGRQIQKELGNK